MPPFETIETSEMVAACNGGGGPLGHPRVYLNLGPGRVECPYCSRQFVNRTVLRVGGVVGDSGVAMPSAEGSGSKRPDDSPAPRRVGEVAGGGDE